ASPHPSRLRWPLIAGLIVVLTHGLVDDPLFAQNGTPLMFLLPGLAAALTAPHGAAAAHPASPRPRIALLLIPLAALALLAWWRPLLAAGYANLGAVRLAHAELLGFPTLEWGDQRLQPLAQPAQAPLERAAAINPRNRAAQHRLGLLALLEQDFPAAQGRLEAAYRIDPDHAGVRKALAYTYVWLGEYDRAAPLLAALPEAVPELTSYVAWQRAHGRPDLAERAQTMLQRLAP
ncbi:MAG: tetratricopeptide repeat protein, partial [Chloroflexi bacterium]|nr:tetratricopeptide repeat protein [Chloroflexota bacterium]